MYGKKVASAACVSLFLIVLMFSVMRISASTDTVGVKAGDWAGFGDVSFEWESNIPGTEQPPPELNISWFDTEVVFVAMTSPSGSRRDR